MFLVFSGTYRKFKEKLVSQNPSLLENKVSHKCFVHASDYDTWNSLAIQDDISSSYHLFSTSQQQKFQISANFILFFFPYYIRDQLGFLTIFSCAFCSQLFFFCRVSFVNLTSFGCRSPITIWRTFAQISRSLALFN